MTVAINAPEPHWIAVTAPARLHLGFVDLHGGLGRRYGSLGLALEQPSTRILLRRAVNTNASGPDCERALRYAQTLLDGYDLTDGVEIVVEDTIPAHAGLGSGTQLALAVGSGIARLFALPLDTRAIGERLARGARSGIGIGAFAQGGFLVDGGRGNKPQAPPIIARLPMPKAWRILLIFDHQQQGMHGQAEQQAFTQLSGSSEADANQLARLLMMQALPALAEADIDNFGQAITCIQQRVGNHFAAAQGGRFSSPIVANVLSWLTQQGVAGVGQSSWGPTGFALCADQATAQQLLIEAQHRWHDHTQLEFYLAAPRNQPAHIDTQLGDHPSQSTPHASIKATS